MTIKSRIEKLEAKTPEGDNLIVIDWGDDRLNVNGQELTRAEFDRLYPDAIHIDWDDQMDGT